MIRLLVVFALAALGACSRHADGEIQVRQELDQCRRQEAFERCMKLIPAGPQVSKYNDWDEVVNECDSVAFRTSYRDPRYIKPECLPNNAPAPSPEAL